MDTVLPQLEQPRNVPDVFLVPHVRSDCWQFDREPRTGNYGNDGLQEVWHPRKRVAAIHLPHPNHSENFPGIPLVLTSYVKDPMKDLSGLAPMPKSET